MKVTGVESQVNSSTQVEMIALISALEHAATHAVVRDVNIYSDSLSAWNFLNTSYWKSSLGDTKQRLRLAYCRAIQVCSVSQIHVPAHSGIWQNELADRTAKSALADSDIANLNWDISQQLSSREPLLPNHPCTPSPFPFPEESPRRPDLHSSEPRLRFLSSSPR